MEESLIFDSSQYARFPNKELEEAYMMYLSGTLSSKGDSTAKPRHQLESSTSKEASLSNDEIGLSSDVERGEGSRNRTLSHGRSRRNTSSSGRRRKRTEGEDGVHGDAVDILSYDLAHHCKFFTADLESRYQMFLSGTLSEHGGSIKPTSVRNGKARSQRSRERSSKSSDKSNRRLTPTEERKVSPTDFEEPSEYMDQRNGNRNGNRFRGKPRVSYPRTPYQGSRRCCGEFHCPRCYRYWTSANSRANKAQPCNGCGLFVYPHAQWPLSWLPMEPSPTWDDLEDQENRHVNHRLDEHYHDGPSFDKEGVKLGNDRRPGYRSRRPLRPHHRRRREQDV